VEPLISKRVIRVGGKRKRKIANEKVGQNLVRVLHELPDATRDMAVLLRVFRCIFGRLTATIIPKTNSREAAQAHAQRVTSFYSGSSGIVSGII
jgi:hypothetical protein